jgi:hypothetical protein
MRPRLKRTIEPIQAPDGDLVLMRSSADDIRIRRPGSHEKALLQALDGSQSVQQLEGRFGAQEVGDAMARMQELELVEDASDDDLVPADELTRFDRQLRYFGDLRRDGGLTPSECQARLRAARVVVLGVGGLGGRVAWELACCGVGELLLIDGDRVELSNLNRQIQYTEADIGSRKVEIMATRLRAFNSRVRVMPVARRMESQAQLADYMLSLTPPTGRPMKSKRGVMPRVSRPASRTSEWPRSRPRSASARFTCLGSPVAMSVKGFPGGASTRSLTSRSSNGKASRTRPPRWVHRPA